MRNNRENLPSFLEQEKEIGPERIFYHNAAHAEIKEGEAIDFFAPKSENTLRINNFLEKSAKKISEAQELIKSAEFSQVKEILLADFKEFDGKRKENVGKLNKLLKDKNLPNIKKLINASGDIFELRRLVENQVQDIKENITLPARLRKIKEIRDTSYFLTKEDESFRGWSLVSFDMEKILGNNFSVFEANNEAAHAMFGGNGDIFTVEDYANTFKKIKSLKDCLKYKTDFRDDYDRCPTEIFYSPYCPEYLIQPPTKETVINVFKEEKEKLGPVFDKYWIIPAYFYDNTEPILHTTEIEHAEKIDFLNLDPINNEEDYRLIVNILFNESIIDTKIK